MKTVSENSLETEVSVVCRIFELVKVVERESVDNRNSDVIVVNVLVELS